FRESAECLVRRPVQRRGLQPATSTWDLAPCHRTEPLPWTAVILPAQRTNNEPELNAKLSPLESLQPAPLDLSAFPWRVDRRNGCLSCTLFPGSRSPRGGSWSKVDLRCLERSGCTAARAQGGLRVSTRTSSFPRGARETNL